MDPLIIDILRRESVAVVDTVNIMSEIRPLRVAGLPLAAHGVLQYGGGIPYHAYTIPCHRSMVASVSSRVSIVVVDGRRKGEAFRISD